jgi:SAM-dependent methyltransferase
LTAPSPDLSPLAAATQEVYERNAARFDVERSWLDRFLDLVTAGGRVLDVGCGTGDPMAAYMAARGFRVVGIDASRAMLDIARARFPAGDWRHGDMRALDLPERFDGILGWNSFFHLTADEQRAVLPILAAHMNPGAALMLTVGPEAGEVGGHVGDDAVYHASLALAEYTAVLQRLGVSILAFAKEDPQCDLQTIPLARRGP